MRTGLNVTDREIAGLLRQRLAQGAKIEDFRVFGSRVRGEATPESDLDVYIVVTDLTPVLRRWIDEIAWEVGFDNDRVISTLVTTRRGLEQVRSARSLSSRPSSGKASPFESEPRATACPGCCQRRASERLKSVARGQSAVRRGDPG